MSIPSSNSAHAMQNLQRQYAENALLPDIDWQSLFSQQCLSKVHLHALDTIYQTAIPLALTVFKRLNLDVFAPAAYQPQGLGLFDKLAQQEQRFLTILADACTELDHATRHQIWSMILRGGAVLVFKSWLGLVKTGQLCVDLSQFDELSNLLWIKSKPEELARLLHVDSQSNLPHVFLSYDDSIFLDRFNSLECAILFCKLGVYDPVFLSLRDEHLAAAFIQQGMVTSEQIEELESSLNPLNCQQQLKHQDYLV